jgi:SGNH hydrolase-like domain, acetyltransferase AlgX
MNHRHSSCGTVMCAALVLFLSLPMLGFSNRYFSGKPLYGYTEKSFQKPSDFTKSYLDKSLQKWIETVFDNEMGFRNVLLRSFNELSFGIFRESPKLKLHSTREHGLYSEMSIDSLNDEVLNKKQRLEQYKFEAQKLLKIQKDLAAKGKYFIVLIGSSKPYIYPESLGSRYLVADGKNIVELAASYGDVLQAAGVNVVDSGPLLRSVVARTGQQTHAHTGVHWNYYAGCLAGAELLKKLKSLKSEFADLNCGLAKEEKARNVDLDGLYLLNILSGGNLQNKTLYPSISESSTGTWKPKIVFIGDSFSDQVRDALKQGDTYSKLVMSSYFRTRENDNKSFTSEEIKLEPITDENKIRESLMSDIEMSDVVVLQMVDYNVVRYGYGFPDYYLQNNK